MRFRVGLGVFLLALLVVPMFFPVAHAVTWWDSGWMYKTKLTLDETKVDADLTDFPVLIYLNSARVDWVHVQDDLDDLRFLDSTESTVLKAELEKSVTNSEAWIWVKVPAVSGTVDTVIWVYYGNVGAASAWDAANVWSADAVMVQHMKSATNTTITDSTGYANNGVLSSVGTFGISTGASYTAVPANRMYGSKFTSPADAAGVVNSITWYGRRDAAESGNSKAILVDSSLNIVAVSGVTAFTATAGEWTNTFSSPPTITANTVYWLMMIFDVTTRFNYGAGAANQGALDTTNSYTTPTNPTDATYNNNQYRIRATYTSTLFQTGAGKIDSALTFDAINDYVSVADSVSLDITGAVSVGAWVKPTTGAAIAIINKGTRNTIAHYSYRLIINAEGTPRFSISDGTNAAVATGTALTSGQWVHLIGTWDGTTAAGSVKVYAGGVVTGSNAAIHSVVATQNTDGLLIGIDRTDVITNPFNGIIDENRVYNTTKSAPWILADYNSGADTLITYGSEELYPRTTSLNITTATATTRQLDITRAITQTITTILNTARQLDITRPTSLNIKTGQGAMASLPGLAVGSGLILIGLILLIIFGGVTFGKRRR